jgi:hypothetical protein
MGDAANSSAASSSADGSGSNKSDVGSLMTQVTSLANEKRMLQDQLKENAAIVARFKDQEKADMKKKFDTLIKQWIDEGDWTDPELKESVLSGMQEMMENGKKDSTIWNMVCCASATHARNATKMNELQEAHNRLTAQVEGGSFRADSARVAGGGGGGSGINDLKRKEPEPSSSSSTTGGGPRSIWDDFGSRMRSETTPFIPDPETFRTLRQGLPQESS